MFIDDTKNKKGMDVYKLSKLISDIDTQPNWRHVADKCADYYDDKQVDPADAAIKAERGQPNHINNLIRPAIDSVLGMEAKTRTDWIVKADNDEYVDVSDGLNVELNEAARIVELNRSVSDAYSAQIKSGLAWVEINRTTDPFSYKYRANTVHRNEIYWDFTAERPDISDARWLIRKKWYDLDQAELLFPDQAELLRYVKTGWSDFIGLDENKSDLVGAYTEFCDGGIDRDEYIDTNRDRVMIYECWYREWARKPVIRFGDNVAVLDTKNRVHQALLESGKGEVYNANFPVMRLAYFIGCHRVIDIPSPLPHNHFPYVPFWGYREDITGIPYGLIRGMLSPQDEVNMRHSKLTSQLNSFNMYVDDDALKGMNINDALDEAYKTDSVFNLNPDRKNANGFRVERDQSISSQQFEIMRDGREMIGRVGGVTNSFMGNNSNANSGIAINSLIEQSSTTLAEINDNYRYARRACGELLLAFIVDDLKEKENHEVIVKAANRPKRVVSLNVKNEYGLVDNDVTKTKTMVVLDDIQNSAGYRSQNAQQLSEIIQTIPDNMKAALIPYYLKSTDHPDREKIVDEIMKVTGQQVDPESMSEEEQQQYAMRQQEQQRQQQIAQMMEQLTIEKANLELAEMQQKVRRLEIDNMTAEQKASLAHIEEEKAIVDVQLTKVNIKKLAADIAAVRSTPITQKQELINYV